MSDARQRVKESLLVAADQYEADGEWWRADAVRALARGDIVEIKTMPINYGTGELHLRLRYTSDEWRAWRRAVNREELEAMYGPRVFHP